MCKVFSSALLLLCQKNAFNEDFKTDNDKNCTAEKGCLTRKLCAKGLAQKESNSAQNEGDNGNDKTANERHQPIVFGNGKADRERIN